MVLSSERLPVAGHGLGANSRMNISLRFLSKMSPCRLHHQVHHLIAVIILMRLLNFSFYLAFTINRRPPQLAINIKNIVKHLPFLAINLYRDGEPAIRSILFY